MAVRPLLSSLYQRMVYLRLSGSFLQLHRPEIMETPLLRFHPNLQVEWRRSTDPASIGSNMRYHFLPQGIVDICTQRRGLERPFEEAHVGARSVLAERVYVLVM